MESLRKILFIAMFFCVSSYSENVVKKGYWPAADLFKPGDAIKVSMFPDSTIMPNGIYPIDEKGFVDLPSIGLLDVNNMNEQQFIEICQKVYSGHLRFLEFNVRPMIRIACLGGFQEPGLYWVNPNSSLWEVVKKAGGPVGDDSVTKMKLKRNGKVVSRNLELMFQNGESLSSQGVVSGDQFTISTQERRNGSEIVTQVILPIISSVLSIAMTSLTIYTIQNN